MALVKGNTELLRTLVSDEVRWDLLSDPAIEGKDRFLAVLEEGKADPAIELKLLHIATHGKTGAADGRIRFKSGKTQAFCNVYEFVNAKGTSIKTIISYRIESK